MAPTKRTKDKTSKVVTSVTKSKTRKDTLQLESEEEDSDLEFSGDESGRLPRGSTLGNGRLSKTIPRQQVSGLSNNLGEVPDQSQNRPSGLSSSSANGLTRTPTTGRIEISSYLDTQARELREREEKERADRRKQEAIQAQQRKEEELREKAAERAAHKSREERILKELAEEEQRGRTPCSLQHFAPGDPIGWLPHETLNAKIHLAIVESVQHLTEVGDRLVHVLEVDRLTIGNDASIYPFHHLEVPGQDTHSIQRRTMLAISSEADNIFTGSSVEEIAAVIQQLINQRNFFNEDCWPQPLLAMESTNILNEAICLAHAALPRENDKARFLLTRDISQSLSNAQRTLFEPKSGMTLPRDTSPGLAPGYTPSFLTSMEGIPTETTFVPGKPDSERVLKYVRD